MEVLTNKQKTPQVSATFFDDDHEDDLNHAETAGVQKSAVYRGFSEVKTPPLELRAIRNHCLWCGNGSPKEVRLCPSTNCALHPLRFGKRSVLAPSPLRAIRAKCKDCSESLGDVRHCDMTDCALYPYRMGHRPKATKHLDVVFHSGQSIETR